jgi:DNA helicase HerA-like ATPase
MRATSLQVGFDDWQPEQRVVYLVAALDQPSDLEIGTLVKVSDQVDGRDYFGEILKGPFFPSTDRPDEQALLRYECRLMGCIDGKSVKSTVGRPRPGSTVEVVESSDDLDLGFMHPTTGNVLLGSLRSDKEVFVSLDEANKAVLPRNIGVFGTVGSGKSNTTQVIIEEAAKAGWSVVVVDVEGEYLKLDRPNKTKIQRDELDRIGRPPNGVDDFQIFVPAAAGKRRGAKSFVVPIAGYPIELLGALLDVSDAQRRLLHKAAERLGVIPNVEALANAIDHASVDGFYESTKEILLERLRQLAQLGLFDDKTNSKVEYLSARDLIRPGRVSVVDVSDLQDKARNLTLGYVLELVFKIVQRFEVGQDSGDGPRPPVLVVMEEVQTFFGSSDDASRIVMDFVQDVARRGRKRWLSLLMVSQQPSALPSRLFELLNTRLIHQTRSEVNINALRRSCGDVEGHWWKRVADFDPGTCLLSGPAVNRAVEVRIRPSSSERLLVD